MARAKLLTVLLASILMFGARAQPASRPARSGEGSQSFPRIRAILDDLKLSDDQKKKVEDVFTTTAQNFRAMAPEMRDMSQQQRQEKYKEFQNDLRDEIGQVLTPDQKKKFNEAMQNMRGTSGPGATTQPGAGGGPGTQLMMRMRSRIEQLGLTDDQKQKVKKLMEETGEKMKQIAASTERGSQDMRDKARDVLEKTRDSLKEILTPEQFEKLTSGLRDGVGGGDKPATQPKMIEEKMKDEKMSDEKSPAKDDEKKSSSKDDSSSEAPANAPQAGQTAPAFALQKVDSSTTLQLSAFKGKVVVLTFASYSSPTFRRRAAGLEDLRRRNDNRANFLFIYTKEAHPKGGWEVDRNKDEDVQVEQAKDLSERSRTAKQMHEALHFSWPMLTDSMDDSAAKAYGAGECTTIIINRDGTIYSRLQWSDPYTLKRQLDELFSKRES